MLWYYTYKIFYKKIDLIQAILRYKKILLQTKNFLNLNYVPNIKINFRDNINLYYIYLIIEHIITSFKDSKQY